jgi:cell division protein FtsI (penicillin-binding protein 3)
MRTGIDPRSARWIALRIGLVAAALGAAFLVVAARAVQLQVVQRDRLGSLARDQYLRQLELKPRRGAITDRNGATLAADAEADSVFVDPQELEARTRPGQALGKLARVLGVEPRGLERRAARGGRFVWVKRRVSPAEADAVRALNIPGVGFVKETRRYYPRREMAGQLLGFVGDDGAGLEGIEAAYDDALRGESVRVPSLRDARGLHLLGEAPASARVMEGARVELTIDQGLQLAAERALAAAVAQTRAAAGMVVAVDPATGEVLALANAPTFNPNAPKRGEEMRNRAVLDSFEPGSTMKTFSLAGALEEGTLRTGDAINCENGAWAVGSHVIHDHKGMGWVGPARVMAASSNIGAAKVGQRLGRERLQRTMLAFGFGERTGIGLPAEPRGVVPYPRAEVSLATMSFGQGMTASALQVTQAMAAIANGGTLMRPWLVRRVVDPGTGRVLAEAAPTPVRRAVRRDVAATVARWLEGVVSDPDGTGKRARLDGWRAAGKTGTAQKADPVSGGYSADRHFSSFVGFAPAQAPRVVVGVFIDEPKGEIYGGEVAAPVFREVTEHALKALGVPPSERIAAAVPAAVPAPEAPIAREAAPPPLEELPRRAPRGRSGVAVPSVEGLPARAALRALEAVDLVGETAGSGRVTGQSPRPGDVVERGARVRLRLAPPG